MAFPIRRARDARTHSTLPRARAACVLLLSLASLVAGPRPLHAGPEDGRREYALLVEAAKAKRWAEALPLAVALVERHPDAPFAASATYLASESAWQVRRYELSLAYADRYGRTFPRAERATRMGLRRGEALFRLGRGADARAAFEAFLRSGPDAGIARRARDLLARIDPADVTVRGSVVLDYRGKYEGDPTFSQRMAEVERVVPEALRRVRERIGLADGEVPSFRIRFRDTGEIPEGTFMSSITELVGDAPRLAVVVRTEKLVVGYDLTSVLCHELTHVVLRGHLGYAADAVPPWAREGSAMWVAEQGRRRLTTDLWSLAGVADPLPAILDGLTDPTQVDDYAENWLAFAWIEATKGLEAARGLVRRICERGDADAAFAAAAGLPFAAALAQERTWAEAVVRADLAERGAYLEARNVFATGKPADAVAAYDALLSARPDHLFAPKARMDRAVALSKAARFREANAAFAEILASPWADEFADDVVESRARAAAAHKDLKGVELWGGRFLRDFSWSKAPRLEQVRALWTKAGGTPPPPPPEAPLVPSDDPEGFGPRDGEDLPEGR